MNPLYPPPSPPPKKKKACKCKVFGVTKCPQKFQKGIACGYRTL